MALPQRSSEGLFSLLFVNFINFGYHFDPQWGPLGLTFSRFFRVWTPLGPVLHPPWAQGGENGATGLQKDATSVPK